MLFSLMDWKLRLAAICFPPYEETSSSASGFPSILFKAYELFFFELLRSLLESAIETRTSPNRSFARSMARSLVRMPFVSEHFIMTDIMTFPVPTRFTILHYRPFCVSLRSSAPKPFAATLAFI